MSGQRFPLDRRVALSYIGACALLAACRTRPAPLVALPLEPADHDAAVTWARATLPRHQMAIRLRWKYQDREKRWGGRGTVRIGPPDSLRFDYAGPLGLGAGAAVLEGDSLIWSDPPRNFRSIVPGIRMLWAGLGMARPPAADAAVSGLRAPPVTIWRFTQDADTFDYRVTDGADDRMLEAEWRQAGTVKARSRTQYTVHAMPASARIDFPEGPARFELSVVSVDTAAVIAPALWRSRR